MIEYNIDYVYIFLLKKIKTFEFKLLKLQRRKT
jgi:hypothetical protein